MTSRIEKKTKPDYYNCNQRRCVVLTLLRCHTRGMDQELEFPTLHEPVFSWQPIASYNPHEEGMFRNVAFKPYTFIPLNCR